MKIPEILDSLDNIEILGLTIIGEARGETIAGQVAVGSVIRNRKNSKPIKYSRYHDVVLEPKQFSCWNSDDPNYVLLTELATKIANGKYIDDGYMKQCMYVAAGIVNNDILDNTHGALHYMTSDLFFSSHKPSWAVNVKNLKTVDGQVFFNV